MKTKSIMIVLLIATVIISCGDVKNQVFAQKNDTLIVNEPVTSYNVQRYFDENGNQIGYDSVYTYSYSYSGNGEMPEDVQKMMEQFNNNFSMTFGNSFMMPNQSMGNQFFNDDFFNSFFNSSPFLNDPFFNNYPNSQNNYKSLEQIIQQHQKQIRQMQQLMDSVYNQQNQINRQEQYNNQKTKNNTSSQKSYKI